MSQASPNTNPIDQLETAASIVNLTDLLEQNGTVPFLGVNDAVDAEYPDAITARGRRYVQDEDAPQSFKTALSVLPNAGEGELWANNEFVAPSGDGSVDVNLEALRNVHGLDIESLESRTGMTLSEMVERADPEPLVGVDTHKDIIDRRRLALRTLGFDVRFRWQIASSRYTPGNMREFFKRKIAACQQHGAQNMFGWIRHYDWGGSVNITTIYPSKAFAIDATEDTDLDLETGELTIATDAEVPESDTDSGRTEVYYGDQIKYDFRGHQKLSVTPVIFIPEAETMIPLPHPEADLSRKHTGNLMGDAIDWHERVLDTISDLCETVNQEIKRARLVAIDFADLPFSVEDFYRFIGVRNDEYVEAAADRATALAQPSDQPTLWNLQLSLKLALLDNFDGNRAGATYQEYQELAGEILRHPATMITTAKEQFRIEAQADDEDDVALDAEQTTLADSLEDVLEMTGVTENRIDASEAEQIERRVQQRLPNAGGEA